jgi:hypothetical protein
LHGLPKGFFLTEFFRRKWSDEPPALRRLALRRFD